MRKITAAIIIAGALLAACAGPTAAPTAPPSQAAVEPTPTAVPTAPAPTAMPTPIATSTRTPTPVPPTPTATLTPTSTAIPHDVPPVIQIEAPTDAVTGERVVLDASRTFDYDGDEITFQWAQVHNPDRYTGTEYVTGNDVVLRNDDQPATAFAAQWPGNYRFEVSATDRDGGSRDIVDVLVRSRTSAFEIRGFSDGLIIPYSLRDVDQVLDRLAEDGANFIQLCPMWNMPSLESTDINPCPTEWYEGGPCTNYSDELLTTVIEAAHQHALGVMVKPHLAVGQNWSPHYDIRPADWNEWFESYTGFLLHYAQIAERSNVEIFCLGNELISTHSQERNWQNLVMDIRRVFSGDLTYSHLYLQGGWEGQAPFPAWGDLDYVGVSFYFPGTGDGWFSDTGRADPSVDEMIANIQSRITLRLVPAARDFGLPIIATEVGIPNCDGGNMHPEECRDTQLDNQEQVDYYEAVFRLMSQYPWFRGFFVWSMQLQEVPVDLFPPLAPDIRGQPAELAIRTWFK